MELNININQKKLTEFCKKHGITVTGYSTLGRPGANINSDIPNFLENSKLIELHKKYGKTPAQIALRFAVSIHISNNCCFSYISIVIFAH